MKNIYYLSILLLLWSCSQPQSDKIILTQGLPENPQTKRIGIEIRPDSIFYCQEITGGKGIYNFFKRKGSPKLYEEIKNKILAEFKNINQSIDFTDGQLIQMIYISSSHQFKTGV